MAGYEDLFADPMAALGYGLLTSRENPLGTAAMLLQQSGEAKLRRKQEEEDRDLRRQSIEMRRMAQTEQPSAVREYEYYNNLSDADKEKFLSVKRAQQILNLGGTQAVLNPMGGVAQSYPVTPKPSELPSFKGAQKQAEKLAELSVDQTGAANKKAAAASDVLNLANEAEQYLNSASGGYMDSALATGKRVIGRSDTQTQADAALDVIGGRLVAAMPRMEGPQSNYDVQLYREMAGRVSDRTVPVNDRRAALKQLIRLNEKYAAQQPQTQPMPQLPPQPAPNAFEQRGGIPASPSGDAIDYREYFK